MLSFFHSIDLLAYDLALGDELNRLMVDYKELDIKEQLGKGGFATVYKGILNNDIVAVKQLDLVFNSDTLTDDKELTEKYGEFRREVSLMR